MSKVKLSATVLVKKGTKKTHFVSEVLVRANEKAIAFLTLGGRYDENQALAEFKKNPTRFMPWGKIKKEELSVYAKA